MWVKQCEELVWKEQKDVDDFNLQPFEFVVGVAVQVQHEQGIIESIDGDIVSVRTLRGTCLVINKQQETVSNIKPANKPKAKVAKKVGKKKK